MKVGLVGVGICGTALYKALSPHHLIMLYDKNPHLWLNLDSKEKIKQCDVVFIQVPTPYRPSATGCDGVASHHDQSAVDEVMAWLHPKTNREQVIVLRSTVLPGTTGAYIDQYQDYRLTFMPEFLDEGVHTAYCDIVKPRRPPIIGTRETYARQQIMKVFDPVWKRVDVPFVHYTNPTQAELIKYLTNCYYALKCQYAHQVQEICLKTGIDPGTTLQIFSDNPRIGKYHWEVIPWQDFPLGKKCLPKDTRAFAEWLYDKNYIPYDLNIFQFIVLMDERYKDACARPA
jgi:nucleotide sugar dehydrogenase